MLFILTMSDHDDNGARGDQAQPDNRVLLEALTGQLQQLMWRMDNMQEIVGRIEAEQNRRPNDGRGDQGVPRQPRAQPYPRQNYCDEEFEDFDYEEGGADRWRYEQGRWVIGERMTILGAFCRRFPSSKAETIPRLTWSGRRGSRMSSTSITIPTEKR